MLAVAAENARRADVAERYALNPGSAFDVPWGGPYDIVLLTNFLHHFDVPTCEQLAAKAYAALAPGGRALTLEFIPEPDRITPPSTANFALVMLATTAHGDAMHVCGTPGHLCPGRVPAQLGDSTLCRRQRNRRWCRIRAKPHDARRSEWTGTNGAPGLDTIGGTFFKFNASRQAAGEAVRLGRTLNRLTINHARLRALTVSGSELLGIGALALP